MGNCCSGRNDVEDTEIDTCHDLNDIKKVMLKRKEEAEEELKKIKDIRLADPVKLH
jgi:hypothetical protein